MTHVAFLLTDLEVSEVWAAYVAYGGNRSRWVVHAYLHGLKPLPAYDSDLLAVVINERLADLHIPHLASYRD